MHADGLWCGDVRCRVCAANGATKKGLKDMISAKSAVSMGDSSGPRDVLYEEVKKLKKAIEKKNEERWRLSNFENAGLDRERKIARIDTALKELELKRTRAVIEYDRLGKAKDEVRPVKYSAEAVQKEINKDKRIGGKEAKLIHALLKGRTGDALHRALDAALDPTRAKNASPFDRDTDKGAAKIVKRAAAAGLSAKAIAKKYGFSLSFIEEELSGKKANDAVVGPTSAEIKAELRAIRPQLAGQAGIVLKRESPERYAVLEKRLTDLLDAATTRAKDSSGTYDSVAKGSAAFGHEKQMTPSEYLRKCAKIALKSGESEAEFVAQFKEAARGMASAAYKAAAQVGKAKDSSGTYDVSYALNGTVVFQVTAAQFREWAKKNDVQLSNFKSVLEGLRKFTGDPRIKDWELDVATTRAKDSSGAPHVGMLGVNSEKALQLKKRLEKKGFEYRFPMAPPTAEMVRHGFVKRNEPAAKDEWLTLNERKNGCHNITTV